MLLYYYIPFLFLSASLPLPLLPFFSPYPPQILEASLYLWVSLCCRFARQNRRLTSPHSSTLHLLRTPVRGLALLLQFSALFRLLYPGLCLLLYPLSSLLAPLTPHSNNFSLMVS